MSEIDALMARAREFMATAQMAMRRGDFNSTANRAYYAMFHAAHALLLTKGIRPTSHGGTMSLIGLHFVNTKELSAVHGKALKKAYLLRQRGDYEIYEPVKKDEARILLKEAKEFFSFVNRMLEPVQPGGKGRA